MIDLSGRPFPVVELGLQRELLGNVACENLTHFFQSLAMAGRLTLHLDVLRGANDHHRAEAAFKSCGIAMRTACSQSVPLADAEGSIPSTKGSL